MMSPAQPQVRGCQRHRAGVDAVRRFAGTLRRRLTGPPRFAARYGGIRLSRSKQLWRKPTRSRIFRQGEQPLGTIPNRCATSPYALPSTSGTGRDWSPGRDTPPDQGSIIGADGGNRTRTVSLGTR
jgi:hypothetical protein